MSTICTSNIVMFRGDKDIIGITFKDENGSPIDITGYTLYLTVKRTQEETDSEAQFQIIQTTHSDPTNGVSSFTIEPEYTNDMTPDTYLYDVQIVDTSGDPQTAIADKFILKADITRTV